ncbi:MAG: DUF3667 domain-containing protein [Pricia sp.]|nr:DUF3667 domain-containing protein [Pricia sp.]
MEDKPTINQKGRYRLKYRSTECLNCGHPLVMSDKFCPNCSQANSNKKLTIKDFLDEFFGSLISYDSKLLKTLYALLLKPGRITKDYIRGKRVSYTNPFRFLLSLAIVYFLLINFSGNFSEWDRFGTKADDELVDFFDRLDYNVSNKENAELNAELNKELDSIKGEIRYEHFLTEARKRDSTILTNPQIFLQEAEKQTFWPRFALKQEFFRTVLRKDSIYNFNDALEKYNLTESLENKWAFNASNGLLHLQRQPGTFISNLISKLPFVIFFFLPVFAIFIWLAYIRKNYTYTDHLIFSFHNTSLLFILLIISYLIDTIFNVSSNWIFFTIFATYLFQAMRKFYEQNVFKTIVKYLLLNTIFFILAMFSTVILFAGNIFTY